MNDDEDGNLASFCVLLDRCLVFVGIQQLSGSVVPTMLHSEKNTPMFKIETGKYLGRMDSYSDI